MEKAAGTKAKLTQKDMATKMNPNFNKGVPVAEGTNWVTGLTHEQRCQKMLEHENKWKRQYNAGRGTVQSFSRG